MAQFSKKQIFSPQKKMPCWALAPFKARGCGGGYLFVCWALAPFKQIYIFPH